MEKLKCHSCATEWPVERIISRSEECPKCRSDARVCLNCRHYAQNAHNQCQETQSDLVQYKDQSNFCEYFSPGGGVKKSSRVETSGLHKLFGEDPPTVKPILTLDDLFKK